MANRVKYGLCNVHYALATLKDDGTAEYGTPKRFPGAVSLSLEPQGDQTIFRADNINYWVGQSNNGYQGDFEIARIIEDFRIDILGDILDGNGALVENADAQPKSFAMMFEFWGDEKKTRHVMYNCTVSRPTIAGQTTAETIEPQTETITITGSTVWIPALQLNSPKSSVEQGTAQYDAWFDAVYIPTTTPTPGPTPTPTPTVYSVTQNLTDVESSFTGTEVEEGAAFEAELTATSGTIDSVEVTMDGVDITETAWSDLTSKVTIDSVAGDIVITASAA